MSKILHIVFIVAILQLGSTEAWGRSSCPSFSVPPVDWTNCFGTSTLANGDKYVGEFKNGKNHGQGTYTYASGAKFSGEWHDGLQHGQGSYIYPNGDKYVGAWKKGLRHGKGIFTYASGKIEEGVWKKNKLVKSKK